MSVMIYFKPCIDNAVLWNHLKRQGHWLIWHSVSVYSMVNDSTTDSLIRWTVSGTSFVVPSSEKFGKELLPRFFKHSNFGSFVRQLNMYGFHKVPHLQQGVLKLDGDGEKEKAEVLEFRNDSMCSMLIEIDRSR